MRFRLVEAKADIQKLVDYAGQDLADLFIKNKQRIKPPQNDIYYWLKRPLEEFQQFMQELSATKTNKEKEETARGGAELVAENEYYKVYHITTFAASQKYGANTKWCITGKESGWIEGDEPSNKYWERYTSRGIEFYFFIPKTKDNMKYALAYSPIGNEEIYDETDREVEEIPYAPEVKSIYTPLSMKGIKFENGALTIFDDSYDVETVKKFKNRVKKIIFTDDVTEIKPHTARKFYDLDEVKIGNSVTSIGDHAFDACSQLTSVTIGNSVISIGNDAFFSCINLTNVDIPNSVTSIGDGTFDSCIKLTNVKMGNSVTRIGVDAFGYCNSLTSVKIPGSMEDIGRSAFEGCTNLKSITFEGSAPRIASNPFRYVTATVYYPVNDSSWTDDVQQNYGGKLTWTAK